jgi:hypothetical protein
VFLELLEFVFFLFFQFFDPVVVAVLGGGLGVERVEGWRVMRSEEGVGGKLESPEKRSNV